MIHPLLTIDCVDSLLQEYFGALDVECFVVVFIKAALLLLKPGNGSCCTINLSSKDLALKVLHFSLLFFPSLFLACIFFFLFFSCLVLFSFPLSFCILPLSCFFASLSSSSSVFRGLAELICLLLIL